MLRLASTLTRSWSLMLQPGHTEDQMWEDPQGIFSTAMEIRVSRAAGTYCKPRLPWFKQVRNWEALIDEVVLL